jgi:hypothetical protein
MSAKGMEVPSEELLAIIRNTNTNPKTGELLCTPEIACPKCGEKREAGEQINAAGETEDKPDPCLGILPGVVGACCGHGINRGCICFDDGTFIYGYLRTVKLKPHWEPCWKKEVAR